MKMKDIARKAGVSEASVCLALNGHPRVSQAMSQKVLKVAKDLGYKHQNRRRAKSSRGIRTGYIGLLYVGLPAELTRSPFFIRFVSSLESHLSGEGLQLLLAQVPDPNELPKNIRASRMDGAFLIGRDPDPAIMRDLEEIHTVGVFGRPRPDLDWVTTNASQHGRLAGEYLLGRGHRRLGFLNPDRAHNVFAEYGRAFQETLASHGVEASMLIAQEAHPDRAFWTRRHYREVIEGLLRGYFLTPAQERPTGMYVANDEIALVTYQVLADHGVRGGMDIEIVSNDNDESLLSVLTPRPATIEPHYDEIAGRALGKLLYRIEHPDAPPGAQLLIPPKLIAPNGSDRGTLVQPAVAIAADDRGVFCRRSQTFASPLP